MKTKYFYAESDKFAGDYPTQYTHGFANTKVAIAFETRQERENWLRETKLLSARPITRREALKMSEPCYEGRMVRFCGCADDGIIIKSRW